MTFGKLRHLGTSLLASAGVIGIVVGIAAQHTLGTLVAGLQIAITEPIRFRLRIAVPHFRERPLTTFSFSSAKPGQF